MHSGLRCNLWPRCGHLETIQAVRLKSGSSMSLQQFIKFSGCGEKCIRKFSTFQCGRVGVQSCCTGLPSRMPIKVNPGESALQSAASDGQSHTPRQHNLNYTIWTLDAVSVSVPQLGRTLFNQSSHLGACPRSWGVLQTIKQVIRARPRACPTYPVTTPHLH